MNNKPTQKGQVDSLIRCVLAEVNFINKLLEYLPKSGHYLGNILLFYVLCFETKFLL